MRRWVQRLTALSLLTCVGLQAPGAIDSVAAADGPGLPGMCNGRTDPDTLVIAHASADTGNPKYILNVRTDGVGLPTGVLVFERDGQRLYVDEFCRVWQHLPQQPPGPCMEETPSGATTAHAVGIGTLRDGTRVVVRTDVRETHEGEDAAGQVFRLRYKPMGTPHEDAVAGSAGHDEDGCAGDWVRIPAEGWAPLTKIKVQVGSFD
jgi:hypothetical protein